MLNGTLLCAFALCSRMALCLPDDKALAAQHHVEVGLQLARDGDLTRAETELRKAAELAPDEPLSWAHLGGILSMQRRLQDANVYFEKALRIDPNNSVIRRDLAASQLQLGQLQLAKKNLERVLKTTPRDPPATLLLGMVAENLNDYRAALELLGSVSELVRQRTESLAALAHSYYRTDQRDKARETLRLLQTHKDGPPAAFLAGQVALEDTDYRTAENIFRSIQSTFPDVVGLN